LFSGPPGTARSGSLGGARYDYEINSLETDAVLAAFSSDNITLPTNYRQHAVTVDYVMLPATTLNMTWYLFRPIRAEAIEVEDVLRSRLRLNLSVSV